MLRLDYLAELGDGLVIAGAALVAGASAENLHVVELSLRQARATVIEGVAAYRSLAPQPGPGPELIAQAAREYRRGRR
ncbi:hypothetical protein [Methylocystis sp.]|uniref:hypothetical protein n=1 Tax=Methylocystis sp. TaxID=1911079 RepID=UPI0025E72574|nr:hypothetical protein [Methylocystis sp.]